MLYPIDCAFGLFGSCMLRLEVRAPVTLARASFNSSP